MSKRVRRSSSRRPALAMAGLFAWLVFAPPAAPADEAAAKKRYDGHSLVRVEAESLADLRVMMQISADVWSERIGVGSVDILLAPGGAAQLDEAGLAYEVLQEDVQKLIDAEAASLARPAPAARAGEASFFDDYKTYEQVLALLDELAAERPDLVTRFVVGQTLEGREIAGVRIKGLLDRARPAFLVNGGQHGREWISVIAAAYVADRLVRGHADDPEIRELLERVEFIVVPIVNADGYVYSWTTDRLWRKNRRPNPGGSFGVDPNRNWSTGWGLNTGSSNMPDSPEYRGPAPFSEPCTAALRDFVLANPNIRRHLDLHSYSQLVLGAWGYTTLTAPMSSVITPLGQGLTGAITAANSAAHTFHTGGGPIGLASGVMPDWMYDQRGAYSWTIELRDTGEHGFLLPAAQIVPTSEETFAGVLHLARLLARPLELSLPDGEAPFASTDPVIRTPVRVRVQATNGGALQAGSVRLFSRLGAAGEFAEAATLSIGGVVFEGLLPVSVCGAGVQYYFRAMSTEGVVMTMPADAPNTVYTTTALDPEATFHDDFETDLGWIAGAPGDTALSGVWTRVAPNGTVAQPSFDNPAGAGTQCFVTGQAPPGAAVGHNDIDEGHTTLISPLLDATGPGEAYVSYHRWYSNNQGTNPNTESMPVDISNDGGETWTQLELVTENASRWVFRQWRIADFVAPTDRVRIRFIARDLVLNGPAIVEAGVDDVRIALVGCEGGVFGDINGDGVVNAQDLGLMLGAWGACVGACPSDLSSDGVVSASDLALLLGAWGQ